MSREKWDVLASIFERRDLDADCKSGKEIGIPAQCPDLTP
jgi:hypothetical protein